VDTEPTVEAELLTQAERQTKLLENIQTLLVLSTASVVIGVVVWLIWTFGT
jgi:hypothetical protein